MGPAGTFSSHIASRFFRKEIVSGKFSFFELFQMLKYEFLLLNY